MLLFANWVARPRARFSWWQRVPFELKALAVCGGSAGCAVVSRDGRRRKRASAEQQLHDEWRTIGLGRGYQCAGSHARVPRRKRPDFSGYDVRLLRPETMPKLVRFIRKQAQAQQQARNEKREEIQFFAIEANQNVAADVELNRLPTHHWPSPRARRAASSKTSSAQDMVQLRAGARLCKTDHRAGLSAKPSHNG